MLGTGSGRNSLRFGSSTFSPEVIHFWEEASGRRLLGGTPWEDVSGGWEWGGLRSDSNKIKVCLNGHLKAVFKNRHSSSFS